MSAHYNQVKRYYDNDLWSISQVKAAVGTWITAAEFKLITGETYK